MINVNKFSNTLRDLPKYVMNGTLDYNYINKIGPYFKQLYKEFPESEEVLKDLWKRILKLKETQGSDKAFKQSLNLCNLIEDSVCVLLNVKSPYREAVNRFKESLERMRRANLEIEEIKDGLRVDK